MSTCNGHVRDYARVVAASLFLIVAPGCGTTGEVGVDVRRNGIRVVWVGNTPVAQLSNATSEMVCFCVYPLKTDGSSNGEPQNIGIPPNGGSADLVLPPGTERYRSEVVDCDDEDPCGDDSGASNGFGSHPLPKRSRYWEAFARNVPGLQEAEYVSYDIAVTGTSHQQRVQKLEAVLDGNHYIPMGVEITELRVATPMFDSAGRFLGIRLAVIQDEPVTVLGLTCNGLPIAFDSGFVHVDGYWKYTAHIPSHVFNYGTVSTVTNEIEVTHVSALDGSIVSSNALTWRP
ncbi:MAG: hypothetical protein GY711_13890 [bacterium]|nr:hypothetical protein [bacterium]